MRSLYTALVVAEQECITQRTQKSLQIMQEIIKVQTNKSDVVLNPFMGFGTTGVAALKLGRKFIGIEKDESYFEIAKSRIKNRN